MNLRSVRRWVGGTGLLLWTASLVLPAMRLCAVHPDMEIADFSREGLWFLVGGWGGLFEGQFGWLANPLLLSACLFLLAGLRPALLLSAGCLGLALTALWLGGHVFHFEGGPYRNCGFGPGFWLWLAACAVPAVWAACELIRARGTRPLREDP